MILLRRLAAGFLLGVVTAWATDTVSFTAPARVTYEQVYPVVNAEAVGAPAPAWVSVQRKGSARIEQLGSRIVLGVVDTNLIPALLRGRPLTLDRSIAPGVFLLQAPDAPTALREAAALAGDPHVTIAHPIRRHAAALHAPYAPSPPDHYFKQQWHLENEPSDTSTLGPRADINVRSAWAITQGDGILIANADDGVESTHPDLSANWFPDLQMNFHTLESNGNHSTSSQYHGTATAGLHSAAGNKNGGLGVAPRAKFTSWVIFDSADNIPDEEGMARMFLYASNSVPIQNHSWGNSDFQPLTPGTVEYLAVSNAATLGRNGLGVLMIRSAGNTRKDDYASQRGVGDANLDGYANDPHAITVGAVGFGGRVASYSAPGACILVAAPGGDIAAQKIFSTDRTGTSGLNRRGTAEDPGLADYTYGASGFYGTSAAAPIVTGVTALMLSANPQLSYRDVQHLLLLSTRQTDPVDPDLRANHAGFLVSHNTGFGVPDAGVAVRLANSWSSRPPFTRLSFVQAEASAIPDDGLRVEVLGNNVPPELASIPATGSDGLHPDEPTESLPLVDVGLAASALETNLTHQAGLVRRGQPVTFMEKVDRIAEAGGSFAVVINNEGTTERVLMRDLDFSSIPAVMIGRNSGEALAAWVAADPTARVRLKLTGLTRDFAVQQTLLCEHVGVRVSYAHGRMGDLRVTLRSPGGTISVLHRAGLVTQAAPDELIYWTTHHFYESTAGLWSVVVSDEASGVAGTVLGMELILHGVPIADSDADGLDDGWESRYFGNLTPGPADDPDGDGYSNAREQVMGTDPTRNEKSLALDASSLDPGRVRLSWPGRLGQTYTVEAAQGPAAPFEPIATVPGYFPEAGLILPTSGTFQTLRVRE